MGGDNRESIAQSIARIVKHRKSEIDEGNIIIATVKEVYSDILDLDTFGTMDVILQPSEIEIPEIQLNAHVNNDGTTGISGKYTFPKVGSDIILIMDYRNGHEFYYPLFFSHVDKTFEQFDVEKTSKIVEVTTNDINDPYNTEETGKYSEETQTFEEIKKEVSDGSNTTTVTSTSSEHNVESGSSTLTLDSLDINTSTAASSEPAVLGDTLKSIIDDFIDIWTQAPLWTVPQTGVPQAPVVTQLTALKTRTSQFLLNSVTLK